MSMNSKRRSELGAAQVLAELDQLPEQQGYRHAGADCRQGPIAQDCKGNAQHRQDKHQAQQAVLHGPILYALKARVPRPSRTARLFFETSISPGWLGPFNSGRPIRSSFPTSAAWTFTTSPAYRRSPPRTARRFGSCSRTAIRASGSKAWRKHGCRRERAQRRTITASRRRFTTSSKALAG